MKYLVFALLPAVAALLTSCESAGFSWDAFSEFFTPGVSAKTQVRTWDGEQNPHEKTVTSEPAFLYDAQAKRVQQ